ncbi:MAG: hypothetical protein GY913_17915 [Proteobacteria bacterium]|nr:hypothetical protein [Pseudomonadota bacterium]MCP4918784.1 hypothetical protein [Pseudomonadota bacterium]
MFLALLTLASADDNWTTEAAELLRWPGEVTDNPIVVSVEPGTQVEVLFVDGERVRVRLDSNLGWVDASALTAEAPDQPSLLDGIELD